MHIVVLKYMQYTLHVLYVIFCIFEHFVIQYNEEEMSNPASVLVISTGKMTTPRYVTLHPGNSIKSFYENETKAKAISGF